MRNRVYVRKFDWDEARSLYEQGVPKGVIARHLGVTSAAIHYAVDPAVLERMRVHSIEYQKSGRCIDCGGPCSRNPSYGEHRCVSCAGILRRTSVRPTELRCFGCKEWKPDRAFPRSRSEKHRRGRHGFCTPCGTAARRAWRERNKRPCANGCGNLVGDDAATGLCRSCWSEMNAERRRRPNR